VIANGVCFGGACVFCRCGCQVWVGTGLRLVPPPVPEPAGDVQRSYSAQKANLCNTVGDHAGRS